MGLATLTDAVPPLLTSAAVMVARSWVALTYIVVRSEPFHRMTAPVTKFVPVTVRVNAALPAGAFVGEIALVAGMGLLMTNIVVVFAAAPSASSLAVMMALRAHTDTVYEFPLVNVQSKVAVVDQSCPVVHMAP